jgi:hypothetical protein
MKRFDHRKSGTVHLEIVPSAVVLAPSETQDCLEMLLRRVKSGEVVGVAVVAILSRDGYVAYTRGEARTNPTFTCGALHILSSQLALEAINQQARL